MAFTELISLIGRFLHRMTGRSDPPRLPPIPADDLVIRPPRDEELPLLAEVFRRSWMQTYGSDFDAATNERVLNEVRFTFCCDRMLCAFVEGRLVGFIRTQRSITEHKRRFRKVVEVESIFIGLLYVEPEYQSRGIGSDLVSALRVRIPLAALMVVHVRTGTTRAEIFYQRLGFRNCGTMIFDYDTMGPTRLSTFACRVDRIPHSRLPPSGLQFEPATPLVVPRRDAGLAQRLFRPMPPWSPAPSLTDHVDAPRVED